MNIKEMQKKRTKAEEQISKILFEFMEDTECAVSDIYMDVINVSSIGEHIKLIPKIRIEVKL